MSEHRGENEFAVDGPTNEADSEIDERLAEVAKTLIHYLPGASVEEVDMGGYTEVVINPRD
jgi:hypothetical protein